MLLKLITASAVGYGLYRYATRQAEPTTPVAFADGEATPGFAPVRNAGPEAMASDPKKGTRSMTRATKAFRPVTRLRLAGSPDTP